MSRRRDALLAAHCLVGDQISRQICGHHRRRLRKLGWERAFEPPAGGWAEGDLPARAGNAVDVLIDGSQALPAIAAELEQATSHVHLTGWYFSPDFQLVRGANEVVLRNLLGELAERLPVRMLAWAGAPLPLFRPSRGHVRGVRDQLVKRTKISCALDAKERPMHCHHEKTIVIDDRVAFVGGIDLTNESGDRYDTNAHPSRASFGWHDVSSRIRGPAVADVAEHFRMRWHEVTGKLLLPPETPDSAGEVELQVARTIPERVYDASPRGVFTILESYLRAFASAKHFIYVESQFLWSPEVSALLVQRLREHPNPDFRIVLVLPAKPFTGADDTRGVLGELIEADDDRGRLLACALYARSGSLADVIYVHAKVAIVDDAWLTVGSANLNEHSLFNDTEMNIVTHDPALARETRLRLWSEHLELPVDEIPADVTEAVDDLWKPISQDQLDRRNAGQPLTHRLVRLPNVSSRSSRALGPFSGLFVDG